MDNNCIYHADVTRRLDQLEKRADSLGTENGELTTSTIRYEEQLKTLFKTMDEIKKLLEVQNATFMATLAKMESTWASQFNGVKEDIEHLKARPGRLVDGMVAAGLAAIIGLLIAALGTQILR